MHHGDDIRGFFLLRGLSHCFRLVVIKVGIAVRLLKMTLAAAGGKGNQQAKNQQNCAPFFHGNPPFGERFIGALCIVFCLVYSIMQGPAFTCRSDEYTAIFPEKLFGRFLRLRGIPRS